VKIGSILAKVGTSIIKNVVPGGDLIIDAVNAFLPKEKQLPASATGQQAIQAVNSLSPEQQAQLLSKELDVEIAEINSWTQIQGSLADADKTGNTTRPEIALMMAKVVAFVVISFASVVVSAIVRDQWAMIEKLANCWPLLMVVIGTPSALLRSYFGMRSKDKERRYSAAVGQPIQAPGFLDKFANLIGK